jgi:Holliday junction resolvase
MLESVVVKSIRKFLAGCGCWSAKNHGSPFTPGGRSDIYACCNGRFIALEVKVDPKEGPTELQRLELEELARAGAVTATVHSVEEVANVLSEAGIRVRRL